MYGRPQEMFLNKSFGVGFKWNAVVFLSNMLVDE